VKPKKILIIGPMPEPTTGVSLANKVLVEGLSNNGAYQIKVVNTSFAQFKENLGKFSFSKFFFYLKQNLHVFKVFGVDIVYITPGQTFFGLLKYMLFIVASKILRKELIIHIHGNYVGSEYNFLKGIKKKLFKWLLSQTSKGIVLSESLSGNMSPFVHKSKIFVLYNFVEDFLFIDKKTIDRKLTKSKPKIIFLSNLMEEKGIFDLLEALRILEDKGFEYEAKIAGNLDTTNENKLQAYINTLKKTKYVGVVSGKSKKDLLLWSNIFILPTFYKMEGQPISILEAMATGNIVLTTRHAGIPDIFQNEINGYYAEKNNSNSIVETIQSLDIQSDKFQTILRYNYVVAKKNYRLENFINNIIDIFEA
jgi:glycosyltransferase involved in cell wall biosynthesis